MLISPTNLIYVDITTYVDIPTNILIYYTYPILFWYHFIPTNFIAVAPHGPPGGSWPSFVIAAASWWRWPSPPGFGCRRTGAVGSGELEFLKEKGLVDLDGILILMDTTLYIYIIIFIYCKFIFILYYIICYIIWVSWVILELYGNMDI